MDQSSKNPGKRRDAFGAYFFAVEIDGVLEGFFRSCSGLKSESEVVPLQEGGLNTTEHKLIGATKFPNIVLKQGFADDRFWKKRASFVDDDAVITRFNGTIIQYGSQGGEVGKRMHSWTFREAWICKWEGPEFDGSKNEISVETIEIAHEGLSYREG